MSAAPDGGVVTFGAHIVDMLGRPVTDIPPGQGHRVLEQIRITVAGTAAGTSVDLVKLGVPVRALGAVGADELGDFLVATLRRYGVNTGGLARLPGVQTGSSILPIRPNGERPALVVRGANGAMRLDDLDLSVLAGAELVHIGAPDVLAGLSGDDLARLAVVARSQGAIVTLDVLSSGEKEALVRLAPMLASVNHFMPNEEQLRGFTGESDLERAAQRFLALGVETVVVSRGVDGLSVIDADGRTDLPAYPTEVVDTTGCGDAVSAGVIAGLVRGWPLIDAARLGLAAASLVATGLGSDAGIVDFTQTAMLVAPGADERLRARIAATAAVGLDPVRTPPRYDELPADPDECPSAWTLFGENDDVGLFHLQTPERIAAAATLVRSGKMFSLNAPIDAIAPPMYGRGAVLHVLHEDPGVGFDDHLDGFYPQVSSQWDALSHAAWRPDVFFGGASADDVCRGNAATIEAWAERGIAGRGVLLDLDRVLGGAGDGFDPASTRPITVDELETARELAGVTWRPGDVLLLHTGYLDWYLRQDAVTRAALARADPHRSVGLAHGEEMVRYIWDAHVSAIATDNPALEAWPVAPGPFGSLHRCLLGRLGVAIGELFALGALAAQCRAEGRYEVFFTAAPLNVPGGVGSTANALAFL